MTKEELIKKCIKMKKHLNRTPTFKEYGNYSYIKKEFGTWTEFLKVCGIEPIKPIFTKEELIKKAKFFYKIHKKVPTKRDLVQNQFQIVNKFGSFNNFLIECKFEVNRKKYTQEEIKKILLEYYKKNGKSLTRFQLNNNKNLPDSSSVLNIFNKTSYNEVLKLLNLPKNSEHGGEIVVSETNEELLEIYKQFSRRIGRKNGATMKDMDESEDVYSSYIFTARFSSMHNLRIQAGFESNNELIHITKEQLVPMLIKSYKKNMKRLTNKEIKLNEELPSPNTILKRFQTTKLDDVWNEIEKLIKKFRKNKNVVIPSKEELKACLLKMTNKQAAQLYKVGTSTINRWREKYNL